MDGYFVHFFAPEGLTPANKNVMFVLDVSGSMQGEKLNQLKNAMTSILGQLRPGDFFNIVRFSGYTNNWKDDLVPANDLYIQEAKDWIKGLIATGGEDTY